MVRRGAPSARGDRLSQTEQPHDAPAEKAGTEEAGTEEAEGLALVRAAFETLAEIGIVHQLAGTELARQLPDGLHPSHFGILRHLTRRGDGRSLQAVADAMQMTKANMTNSVARLAERGLVEVRPNPADGRSKLVFLRPAGRRFVETAGERLAPVMAEIDRRFGLARLAAMRDDLAALRMALDEMRD